MTPLHRARRPGVPALALAAGLAALLAVAALARAAGAATAGEAPATLAAADDWNLSGGRNASGQPYSAVAVGVDGPWARVLTGDSCSAACNGLGCDVPGSPLGCRTAVLTTSGDGEGLAWRNESAAGALRAAAAPPSTLANEHPWRRKVAAIAVIARGGSLTAYVATADATLWNVSLAPPAAPSALRVEEGSVVARVDGDHHRTTALAVPGRGAVAYLATAGWVYSVDLASGAPRKLVQGSLVAVTDDNAHIFAVQQEAGSPASWRVARVNVASQALEAHVVAGLSAPPVAVTLDQPSGRLLWSTLLDGGAGVTVSTAPAFDGAEGAQGVVTVAELPLPPSDVPRLRPTGLAVAARGDASADAYVSAPPPLRAVGFAQSVAELSSDTQGQAGRLAAGSLLPGDNLGRWGGGVAALGDVSGDGVGDLALGLPLRDVQAAADDTVAEAGSIIVAHLNVDGSVAGQTLISPSSGLAPGVELPLAAGDHFGNAIANFPSWDDDGVPELAVAAMDANGGRGMVAILMLSAGGGGGGGGGSVSVKAVTILGDGEVGGLPAGTLGDPDQFGSAVVVLDVDADGTPELVVGARGVAYDDDAEHGAIMLTFLEDRDGKPAYRAHTWIVDGGGEGWSSMRPSLTQLRFATSMGALLGVASSGAPALVVGTARNLVYVLSLAPAVTPPPSVVAAVAQFSLLSATSGGINTHTGLTIGASDSWGLAVGAGDVDGDGASEALVGGEFAGAGSGYVDVLWLLPGSLEARCALRVGSSTLGGAMPSGLSDVFQAGMRFGSSVTVAPLADGGAALVVAASKYSGVDTEEGAAFVLRLVDAAPAVAFDTGVVELSAATEADDGGAWAPPGTVAAREGLGGLGNGLAPLHDVDGDGIADLAVGLRLDDSPVTLDAGSVLVLRRLADGGARVLQRVTSGDGLEAGVSISLAAGSLFGASVCALADRTGAGVGGMAVGAYASDGGRGEVWVIELTSAGTAASAHSIRNAQVGGLVPGDSFGVAVTVVPSVDGDDLEELAVGAAHAAGGGDELGAVVLVFLAQDGSYESSIHISEATPHGWVPVGTSSEQRFGRALGATDNPFAASTGGAALLAIGARLDDDGAEDGGAVYLLQLGDPEGGGDAVVASSKLCARVGGLGDAGLSIRSGDYWGSSVAFAGDLDADGVPELLVGATPAFGYVDVVFLDATDSGASVAARAAVRLSRAEGSPLPGAARSAIAADELWGSSVALLSRASDGVAAQLAIAARDGGTNGGGVIFLLTLQLGPQVRRVRARYSSSGASDASVVEHQGPAALTRAWGGALQPVARVCHEACGGDCVGGGSEFDCGGVCADGFLLAADGPPACCPAPSGGARAVFVDADTGECGGECDESCAACVAAGADACVPLRCASGWYWTGQRCEPYSPPCDLSREFEAAAKTATSDRVCAPCHAACVPGLGCDGAGADECAPAVLWAREGREVLWLLDSDLSRFPAAELPGDLAVGAPRIASLAADARGGGVTLWVLTNDGALWSAQVTPTPADGAPTPVAAKSGAHFGVARATSLSLDLSTGLAYAAHGGAVLRTPLNGGDVEVFIPASAGALAVAVAPWASAVFYASAVANAIVRVSAVTGVDPAFVHAGLGGVPTALAVDGVRDRALLATRDAGFLVSGSVEDGTHHVVLADDLVNAVQQLAMTPRRRATHDATLHASNHPTVAAGQPVLFRAGHTELSARTEGDEGRLTAGTLQPDDRFGGFDTGDALSAVDDVNGDGLPDLVAGLPLADDGAGTSGAVLVMFMGRTGSVEGQTRISETSGLAVGVSLGLSTRDKFGTAVCGLPAAAATGEELPSLAVGAARHDGSARGAVYLLSLLPLATVSAVQVLSDGTAGGLPAGTLADADSFGRGLAAADVDADGWVELLVGAPGATPDGAVYVVWLSAADRTYVAHSVLETQTAAVTPAIGGSLTWMLGDVDGDGFQDFTVGLGGAVGVEVVSVSPAGAVVRSLVLHDTEASVVATGLRIEPGDAWGFAVQALPDLDGDMRAELLVGATHPAGAGYLDVLFLNDACDGVRAGVRLNSSSDDPWPLSSASVFDQATPALLGASLALVGRGLVAVAAPVFTGDGASSIGGAVFVLRLADAAPMPAFSGTLELSRSTDGTPGRLDAGTHDTWELGGGRQGLAAVGDADDDGHGDLLVGMPGADVDGVYAGAALLVLLDGGTEVKDQLRVSSDEGLETGLSLGLSAGDLFGQALCGVEDIDGDGVNDVVIAAPADDSAAENGGALYVAWLRVDAAAGTAVKRFFKITGDVEGGLPPETLAASAYFGSGLAALDVDNDDHRELVVGSYGHLGNAGAVYVLWLDGEGHVRQYVRSEFKFSAGYPGAFVGVYAGFGSSVAALREGALPLLAVGTRFLGVCYVVRLSPDGDPRDGASMLEPPPPARAPWGSSVAVAGDLDNDGLAELLVGAPGDGDGLGYVDILYLEEDADDNVSPRTRVRLDASTGSPLPDEVGSRLVAGDLFGASIAGLGLSPVTGAPVFAMSAPYAALGGNVGTGAVFLVTLRRGASLFRASVTGMPEPTVVDSSSRAQTGWVASPAPSLGGLAAVARSCDAGCAVGCIAGALATDCDGGLCAAGFAPTSDGSGACCPASAAPTFFDAVTGECGGDCHPTCLACTASGPGGCVSGACAAGHWWAGMRCLPHAPPCDAATEYEAEVPTASADRGCGRCHDACVPGLGCDGPRAADCRPALLGARASPHALVWLDTAQRVSTAPAAPRLAASLPANNTARITGTAVLRSEPMVGLALTVDGRLWRAHVVAAVGSVASTAVDAGRLASPPASSLSVNGASEVAFAVGGGRVWSMPVFGGGGAGAQIATDSSIGEVLAVAADPRLLTAVYAATADSVLQLSLVDTGFTVVAGSLSAAPTAVSVDVAASQVLWANVDGELWAHALGGDAEGSASQLLATGVSVNGKVTAISSRAGSTLYVSESVAHETPQVSFVSASTELSHASEGTAWPAGTVGSETAQLGAYGNGVAGCPDLNGDGVPDLLIGSPLSSLSASGAVHVAYLSPLAGVLSTDTILGDVLSTEATPIRDSDQFGSSVAPLAASTRALPLLAVGARASELNGAVHDAAGDDDFGAVFLLSLDYGAGTLSVEIVGVFGKDRGIASGDVPPNAQFGQGLGAAELDDSNGMQELVVGAPGHGTGAVALVVLDDVDPSAVVLDRYVLLSGTSGDGFAPVGHSGQALLGWSVAALGDTTKQATPEATVAIGAPGLDRVYVLAVRSALAAGDGGVVADFATWGIGGVAPVDDSFDVSSGDNWGASTARLGDLDADGVSELVVGSAAASYVDIVFMDGANGLEPRTSRRFDSSLIQSTGEGLPVLASSYLFGASIAAVGELPLASFGGGAPTLAIAAPLFRNGTGAVFVVSMRASPALELDVDQAITLSRATEGEPGRLPDDVVPSGATFGGKRNSIVALPDVVGGDGLPDLAVGAPALNGGGSGEVYLLQMHTHGDVLSVMPLRGSIESTSQVQYFGYAAAFTPDMWHGEWPSIVATSPLLSVPDKPQSGAVWIFGVDSAGAVQRWTRFDGTALPIGASELFGVGVATLDVDGDGARREVAVGSPGSRSVFVLWLDDDADLLTYEVINHQSGARYTPLAGHGDPTDQFGAGVGGVTLPQCGGCTAALAVSTYKVGAQSQVVVYILSLTVEAGALQVDTRLSVALEDDDRLQRLGMTVAPSETARSVTGLPLDGPDAASVLAVGAFNGQYIDLLWLDDAGRDITAGLRVDTPDFLQGSGATAFGASNALFEGAAATFLVVGAPNVAGLGGVLLLPIAPRGRVSRVQLAHEGAVVAVDAWASPSPSGREFSGGGGAGAAVARLCMHGCAADCVVDGRQCDGGACVGGGGDGGECAAQRHDPLDDALLEVTADGSAAALPAAPAFAAAASSDMLFVATCCANPFELYQLGGSPALSVAATATDSFDPAPDSTAVQAVWADFDLNGEPDVYVAHNTRTDRLLLSHGGGSDFVTFDGELLAGSVNAVAVGDCDGDRDLDVYIARSRHHWNRVVLWNHDPAGSTTTIEHNHLGDHESGACAFVDFDEDGDLDVVVAPLSDDGMMAVANDGDCALAESAEVTQLLAPLPISFVTGMALADLDADGAVDVVIANSDGSVVVCHLVLAVKSGASVASFATVHLQASGVMGVSVVDLNADGLSDLAFPTASGLQVLSGGSMADVSREVLAHDEGGAGAATSVVVADVGLDGTLDVVEVSQGRGFRAFRRLAPPNATLVVRVLHRAGVPWARFGGVVTLTRRGGGEGEGGGEGSAHSAIVLSPGNGPPEARFHKLEAGRNYSAIVALSTKHVRHVIDQGGLVDLQVSDAQPVVADAVDGIELPMALWARPAAGCVGIGDTFTLFVAARANESALALAPSARIANTTNEEGLLDAAWTETSTFGTYALSVVVEDGAAGWPQDAPPVSLAFRDARFGVDSAAFGWPRGAPAACADGVRPVAMFDATPPPFTQSSTASFRLTCSEEGCAYQFSLNGGPWQTVGDALSGDGEAGDREGAVGQVPPATMLVAAPPLFLPASSASFEVELMNVGAGQAASLEYRVDPLPTDDLDERWVAHASPEPLMVDGLEDGLHTVQLRAGPADVSPVVFEWTVDTAQPVIDIVSAPPAIISRRSAHFIVAVVNDEPGPVELRYRVASARIGSPLPESSPVPSGSGHVMAAWEAAGWASAGVTSSVALGDEVIVDGYAYRCEFAAVDAAGLVSSVVDAYFELPECATVPAVFIEGVTEAADGSSVALRVASASPLLEWRVVHSGDAAPRWDVTDQRVIVAPAALLGSPHTVEVRAFAPCEPAEGGRPAAKRHSWSVPPLPRAEPPRAFIASGPRAVTTLVIAQFELGVSHGSTGVECAYGYAPSAGAPLLFAQVDAAATATDTSPVWRPCPLHSPYQLGPLQVGRHRLLARARVSDAAPAAHDWTVTAADASVVEITGRQSQRHSLRILATDAAGNEQAAPPREFTWEVDRDAPGTVATLHGQSLFNGSVVPVSVACTSEPRTEACTFCWESETLPAGCSGPGVSVAGVVVPDGVQYEGAHAVTVQAVDGAGNRDPVGETVAFAVDRVGPSLLPLRGMTGSLVGSTWHTNQTAPSVEVSAAPNALTGENDALTAVVVSVAVGVGEATQHRFDLAPPSVGPVVMPAFRLVRGAVLLHDTRLRVEVAGVDLAGNVGPWESLDMLVDTSPPLQPRADPGVVEPAFTNTTETVVGVAGADDDLHGLHVVVIDTTQGVSTESFVPQASRGDGVTIPLAGLQHAHSYVVAGAYEDAAGNYGVQAPLASITVDLVAPNPSLASAPSVYDATNSGLSFLVQAGEARCSVHVVVNDADGAHVVDARGGGPGAPLNVVVQLPGDVVLADGEYVALVWVTDAAGNAAPAALTHAFVVDTRAPVLTIDAPDVLGGSGFTRARQWQATLTCVDASPCDITLDTPSGGAGEAAVDPVSFIETLPGVPVTVSVEAPAEGPFSIVVRVLDAAGNAAENSPMQVAWTFDRTEPLVNAWMWHVEATEEDADQPVDLPPVGEAGFTIVDNDADPAFALASHQLQGLVARVECTEQHGSTCEVRARLRRLRGARAACDASNAESGADEVTDDTLHEWTRVDDGLGAATVPVRSLADGQWQLEVAAYDQAGNSRVFNASGDAYTWWVDTLAAAEPHLTSAQLQDESGGRVDAVSTGFLAVAFELTDYSPLLAQSVVAYELNGDDAAQVAVTAVEETGKVTARLSVGGDGAAELGDGTYVLHAWLRDAAGNDGDVGELTWRVLSAVPDTVVTHQPATVVGLDEVEMGFAAVDDAGTPFPDVAGFEVTLNAGQTWIRICDEEGLVGVRVPPNACNFSVTIPDLGTHAIQARALNALGDADKEPAQVVWTRSECSNTQFMVSAEPLLCEECPAGADCAAPLVTQQQVQSKPGWWTGGDFKFYECPLDSCLGARQTANGTLPSGCAQGYTGRLCSLCDDGYFMQFRKCTACPDSQGASIGALAGIAIALILAAVVLFKLRKLLPIPVGKVVVSFLQIVGSANVAFRIKWPTVFEEAINAMKVAMLDVLTLTRASCAAPMTFYDSFTVTLVIFVGLSLAGVGGMLVVDSKRRATERKQLEATLRARAPQLPQPPQPPQGRAPRDGAPARRARRSTLAVLAQDAGALELHESLKSLRWSRVFSALSMFWLLCYPGVSVKLMRVFKCIEVQGAHWLEADMRLECFTPQWAGVALVSVIMLVVYTFGLPVGVSVWLWSRRNSLRSEKTRQELGFLYEVYGTASGQYLWEVVELVRKLTLTSLVIFFSAGSPFQVCFALVVSAYAHVAHGLFRPFTDVAVYRLQHFSLAVTTAVFSMGVLLKTQGVDSTDQAVLDGLGALLVLLCAAFLLSAAVLAVLRIWQNVRRGGVQRLDAEGGRRAVEMVAFSQGNPMWTSTRSNPLFASPQRAGASAAVDAKTVPLG